MDELPADEWDPLPADVSAPRVPSQRHAESAPRRGSATPGSRLRALCRFAADTRNVDWATWTVTAGWASQASLQGESAGCRVPVQWSPLSSGFRASNCRVRSAGLALQGPGIKGSGLERARCKVQLFRAHAVISVPEPQLKRGIGGCACGCRRRTPQGIFPRFAMVGDVTCCDRSNMRTCIAAGKRPRPLSRPPLRTQISRPFSRPTCPSG